MSGPMRDIDNLFLNGIEEQAEYPSEKVWDTIEADLDKKTADIYKRKYKTLRRSAAILLLLLTAVVIYEARLILKGKENPAGTAQSVSDKQELETPGNIVHADMGKATIAETKITGEEKGIAHSVATTLPENKKGIAIVRKNGTGNADFAVLPGSIASSEKNTGSNYSTLNTPSQEHLALFEPMFANVDEKKDILNSAAGIAVKSSQPSFVQPFSLRRNQVSRDINRFSLSLSFSPNLAWKTIEDNKTHRRGGRRGGGNSGPGSGGGGNGGGGNGGGGNGGGVRPRGQSRRDFEKTEDYNIAYSGALQLGFKLTSRLSLKTGLSYLLSSTSVSSKKAYAARDDRGTVGYRFNYSSGYSFLLPDGASVPNTGDSIVVTNSRNTVSYLGIPIAAEYRIFSAGRFSLSAAAGGQLNFLVNAKTTAELDAASSGTSTASNHTQGLKKAYVSALASITAEMKVGRKMSITLAPETQFGLTYVNTQSWVKTRSNYMGLAAGIKLKL